ncbi:Zwei Ig domain protein zig-8 [Frankliniella fusca]|uniref:Zwei Ig domain protein zig-8 n=1 Tax=Frankliniella fusca TaxID=407009 RepID=A0AAE1HIX9_9NEOP|nr:Zwei Ig domain protein zig-8 [Frankliniella fusca]
MTSTTAPSAAAGAAGALLLILLTCPGGGAVRVQGAGLVAAGVSSSPPRYVMAGQSAVLECRFALEPGEQLQGVTWTRDSHLVYRWLPATGPDPGPGRVLAFGVLEDAVEAAAPARTVRITRATTAMAGNYSCSVHTDRGSAASRRFHLAVLLVCKARIETEDSTGVNCTVGWRVTCARVFPDLNLTAGVFDPEEGRFFDRVTEWTKVVYSDNTFGYHAFKSYHVAEIPKSSVFLWSLSFKDQTPLVSGNVSSGAVHRAWSGCGDPPAPREPTLQVQVTGGPRAKGATRAVYSCANEIPEHDHEHSQVSAKELLCSDGEWIEADADAPWPVC